MSQSLVGRAVGLVRKNAELNGFGGVVEAEEVDVFQQLRDFKSEGRRFDVIVMDPPAFVKSRKALAEAEGVSMHEAALRAIRRNAAELAHNARVGAATDEMIDRWGDVLDRLGTV